MCYSTSSFENESVNCHQLKVFNNFTKKISRRTILGLTKMETVNFGNFNGFCALFENESVNNHPNV